MRVSLSPRPSAVSHSLDCRPRSRSHPRLEGKGAAAARFYCLLLGRSDQRHVEAQRTVSNERWDVCCAFERDWLLTSLLVGSVAQRLLRRRRRRYLLLRMWTDGTPPTRLSDTDRQARGSLAPCTRELTPACFVRFASLLVGQVHRSMVAVAAASRAVGTRRSSRTAWAALP